MAHIIGLFCKDATISAGSHRFNARTTLHFAFVGAQHAVPGKRAWRRASLLQATQQTLLTWNGTDIGTRLYSAALSRLLRLDAVGREAQQSMPSTQAMYAVTDSRGWQAGDISRLDSAP
jgi:hypothetical protein